MGTLRHTLITAWLVLALAGCSSKAAPPPLTAAPSHRSTPTPSATSAPAPPVMPALARRHTAAGAKAFVAYYVDVIDYTQLTLDTNAIEELSAPTCAGCQAGITGMQKVKRLGGHYTGGKQSVSKLQSANFAPGEVALVSFDLSNEPQTKYLPGHDPVINPRGKSHEFISLLPRTDGWIVGEFGEAQ